MNSILLLILTFWKFVSSWFRMKAPNAKRMANSSFADIQIYFQFYTKGSLSSRLQNHGEPCQFCFLESLFLELIWNKLLLNNRHLERNGPINRRKIYIEKKYEDVWGPHGTHDFWNIYFCFPSPNIEKWSTFETILREYRWRILCKIFLLLITI